MCSGTAKAFVSLVCLVVTLLVSGQARAKKPEVIFHDNSEQPVAGCFKKVLQQNLRWNQMLKSSQPGTPKVHLMSLSSTSRWREIKETLGVNGDITSGLPELSYIDGIFDRKLPALSSVAAGTDPHGRFFVDNTKPFNVPPNSQDGIFLERGLCLCRDTEHFSVTCGGIRNDVSGWVDFLSRTSDALNKNNPHAIAVLHGQNAEFSKRQNRGWDRNLLEAAEMVMAKYPVTITIGREHKWGRRTTVFIQHSNFPRRQTRGYLKSLLDMAPENLKEIRRLETTLAQMTGFRDTKIDRDVLLEEKGFQKVRKFVDTLTQYRFTAQGRAINKGRILNISSPAPGSSDYFSDPSFRRLAHKFGLEVGLIFPDFDSGMMRPGEPGYGDNVGRSPKIPY